MGSKGDGTATPQTDEQVVEAEKCLQKIEADAVSSAKQSMLVKGGSGDGVARLTKTTTSTEREEDMGDRGQGGQKRRNDGTDLPSRPRRVAATKNVKYEADALASDDD